MNFFFYESKVSHFLITVSTFFSWYQLIKIKKERERKTLLVTWRHRDEFREAFF